MTDSTPPSPPENEPRIDERGISQVGGPARQNSIVVAAFGVAIVGLLLYFIWRPDDNQTSTEVTAAQPEPFETPQRVEAPAVPEPEPELEPRDAAAPPNGQQQYDPYQEELRRLALKQAEEQRKLAEQRRRSPILIVNKQSGAGQASRPGTGSEVPEEAESTDIGGLAQGDTGASAEERFAARIGAAQVETVRAGFIASRSYMIPQGTTVRGVLETAIQSDLPGFVRATVAHDVHSFDGSRLLIPKASRLIGQYKAGLVRGQTRLFVIWTRILRPDGASIMVGSPGTDLLGRAGLEGDLDTHFFKIFGASILLSLIDGGIDAAIESTRDQGDNSTTIIDDGSSLSRASEIALENSINIPPTIHIDQGTPIQVFVTKDLDFRNVELR